jgi:hypothetical protein
LDGLKTRFFFFNWLSVAVAWCSGSPSAAPSNAGLAGVFGHRLFEFRGGLRFVQGTRASFDDRPSSRVAQGISGSWGAFLLVTYSLGKQRKVTRPKGEKKPINPK